MKMSLHAIVSNSEMTKNYKTCRGKAERLGKIFVLRNNRPDAVLFSINEYEKRSAAIEHQETIEERNGIKPLEPLPEDATRKRYAVRRLANDGEQPQP
jgi:hypothetical protein